MCGRNFLLSDFGDVLANLATTNKAMDKWRLRLDSAGQKVEGSFTAEISTTCFCSLSLALTTPKPRAQVLGYKTPLFLANWQRVPWCLEGGSIQLTLSHWQCVHSLSALRPVVWRGSLNSSMGRLCLLMMSCHFIFCRELLIIAHLIPSEILIRYRITMLCRITIL